MDRRNIANKIMTDQKLNEVLSSLSRKKDSKHSTLNPDAWKNLENGLKFLK